MTALYILDRDGLAPPDDAAALLPAWRRERLDRLRRETARRESLCAGLLWRYAMTESGISPDEPVVTLPAGRPVFAGRDDVFFSLSHSGRYILCAVGASPLGADVQEPRTYRPSIERFLHPDERAYLAAVPPDERLAAFYRVWTRKEAWVKAVSRDSFLSIAERSVLDDPVIRNDPDALRFFDYTLPGGWPAAVCAASEPSLRPVPPASLTGGVADAHSSHAFTQDRKAYIS